MLVKEQNQANFIYGELEEDQSQKSPQSSQLVQFLQTVKMNNQNSEIKLQKMPNPPNLLQDSPASQIVFIRPSQQPENYKQKVQQKSIQSSSPSQVQNKAQYGYRFINSQSVVFPQEQMEESQQSPQSSLRKLYKAMKKQEKQIKHIQIGEKVQQLENENHQYNESQDEQYDNPKSQIRSKSLRQIVLFSIPKFKRIKCLVKIVNDSIFSLETVYHLFLVEEKRLVLTARKKRFRFSSKYEIFGKQMGHIQKMAVVQSNFSRTQYKLIFLRKIIPEQAPSFSSGIIKITKVEQIEEKEPSYNQEQKCYMMYDTNLLGLSQQKMQVVRPKKSLAPSDRFSDIKNAYQNCEFERIHKYSNRMAERDNQGNLILDFKDNSILYSSKNMILEDELSEACIVLGKKRQDLFLLDIMSPFNFIEGFFVAICNLDRKLFVR